MSSTEDTIRQILVSKVYVETPVDRMGAHDSMRDAFGVDSLGFVELRAQCEDEFGVTISDDDFDLANFATIAALAGLVDRLRQESAPATAAQ
jgi:acyl carrier protein